MRSRWRCSARSAPAPSPARSPAPRPRTRWRARLPRARRSARRSCGLPLLSYTGTGRLDTGEQTELVVVEAAREVGKRFALESVVEPAGDQPLDGRIELVGRH